MTHKLHVATEYNILAPNFRHFPFDRQQFNFTIGSAPHASNTWHHRPLAQSVDSYASADCGIEL